MELKGQEAAKTVHLLLLLLLKWLLSDSIIISGSHRSLYSHSRLWMLYRDTYRANRALLSS